MGITGELVRSFFPRNRNVLTHETNGRSYLVDKKRWSSVRSYLCGDEFSSVLAAEDSASIKSSNVTISQSIADDSISIRSSEATVMQPMAAESSTEGYTESEHYTEDVSREKPNSTSNLFRQDDAAFIIQTAFRDFLGRRHEEDKRLNEGMNEINIGTESPNSGSVGTSIEVQTGNSIEVFSLKEESNETPHKVKLQASRLKRDWDDSTVSSNISKMRVKSRLEAATRRERALAYAFSQQLRICSKQKNTRPDASETNTGWSWLERWMATRLPENSLVENEVTKQVSLINNNQGNLIENRLFDISIEAKESCGSNEVTVKLHNFTLSATEENNTFKSTKNKLKATRRTIRRKNALGYQRKNKCTELHEASNKDTSAEAEQDEQKAGNEKQRKKRTKCNYTTTP